MAPKRKYDLGEGPTAREKKKKKVTFARTIAVQDPSGGAPLGNSLPGPSNVVASNSLHGLPSALDVEKFIETRSFEIHAMKSAMKAASSSSTHRAWQLLPRHLRRRAASHDVRRVPRRLREKARAEMDTVRKKGLGRSVSQRGKGKRISRTELFLKRQRNKKWLESHIWHAKRMKMENMWGYRLAVMPTEKSYRPSYRASMHGSILHDASYYSLIELSGPQKILTAVLELVCDPQGPSPGAKRFHVGSRTLDIHIYAPASYPFGLIGPVTVIWRPLPSGSPGTANSEPSFEPTAQHQTKNKVKDSSSFVDAVNTSPPRIVWLRIHPTIADEIITALHSSISTTLRKVSQSSDGEIKVDIINLTGRVNVFEIMGPKANQVLRGALSPESHDEREEFKKFWESLSHTYSSAQVPRGMTVGFKVIDPRLRTPKNAKLQVTSASNVALTLPSATLAQSAIWDAATRSALSKPRFKKKDLDKRRSKNLIPGASLTPLRLDDRVPVLLVQRSIEVPNGNGETRAIHGWTLYLPSGWSMAFLSALVFTGTRVGGQRERQTQAFEAGTMYFPRDYPTTPAFDVYAKEKEQMAKHRWMRKPPAKRVNYELLGTTHPWKADWNELLGINLPQNEGGLVPTQRDQGLVAPTADTSVPTPWLLRCADVNGILTRISTMFNPGAGLLSEINKIRMNRNQSFLSTTIKAADLLKGALVPIRVTMYARGSPDDLALLYAVEDMELKRWQRAIQKKSISAVVLEEIEDEVELSKLTPSPSAVIGYVTTGSFSLSRGEGISIGAAPLVKLLDLHQQHMRLNPTCLTDTKFPPLLVKMRNINGEHCRAAYVEALNN